MQFTYGYSHTVPIRFPTQGSSESVRYFAKRLLNVPSDQQISEWVSSFFGKSAQYRLCSVQCHSIKIAQKLSIYNRFKNDSSRPPNEIIVYTGRKGHG